MMNVEKWDPSASESKKQKREKLMGWSLHRKRNEQQRKEKQMKKKMLEYSRSHNHKKKAKAKEIRSLTYLETYDEGEEMNKEVGV